MVYINDNGTCYQHITLHQQDHTCNSTSPAIITFQISERIPPKSFYVLEHTFPYNTMSGPLAVISTITKKMKFAQTLGIMYTLPICKLGFTFTIGHTFYGRLLKNTLRCGQHGMYAQ